MLDSLIADASGVVAVLSTIGSLHAWRVRKERARADKWQAVAESEQRTNDDLRDQIRDLRTVALVDERVRALFPKGLANVDEV